MRYSKEHAQEVRLRLVKEGGRHVKERGMHGAGVDGIAKRVGLTGAALYTHFSSKQDFLATVVFEELVTTAQRFLSTQDSIEDALDRYMSLAHVRMTGSGCPLPALVADVARSDETVQQAFEKGLYEIVQAIGAKLDDPDQALAVLAAAVGGVAIARALPDDAKAQAVLDSTRELVLSALEPQ